MPQDLNYRVNEVFYSLQGEGPAMGMSCVFVRLTGCPLRCLWCDTRETSWEPQGIRYSLQSLLQQIQQYGKNLPVVITGGEPLAHAHIQELCQELKRQGHAVHLETAGVLFQPVAARLVCISPKLQNSIPVNTPWEKQHAQQRLNIATLQKFVDHWQDSCYFKFVLSCARDWEEIQSILEQLSGLSSSHVYLMPQSRTQEELLQLAPQIAQIALQHHCHFSDRLHLRLWGGGPGR